MYDAQLGLPMRAAAPFTVRSTRSRRLEVMSIPQARRGEAGIALLLAIMALMLLTFLGLTLATTTTTELQIANNRRWELQAQYNAEAGIEAGRRILQNLNWSAVLPPARGGWDPTDMSMAPPSAPFAASRNFEMGNCDKRGDGAGYGVVLNDGVNVYQNVSELPGMAGVRLNGAVTIWVRRDIAPSGPTGYQDDVANDRLILTAEGLAPFADPTSPKIARRVIEITARRESGNAPCETRGGQAGGGPEGNNFYGAPCGGLANDAMAGITAAATASGTTGAGAGTMLNP
jgi:hypothetical protein